MVADGGNFFSISVTPDNRWPAGCSTIFTQHEHHQLRGDPDDRAEQKAHAHPVRRRLTPARINRRYQDSRCRSLGYVRFTGATPPSSLEAPVRPGHGGVWRGGASKTNASVTLQSTRYLYA
jgi:hypothetical protein